MPGMSTPVSSDDMRVRIPKEEIVCINMAHYSGTAVYEIVKSYFMMFVKKNPVKRIVQYMSYTNGKGSATVTPPLIIPADSVKKFYMEGYVYKDISLLYVSPHMHLLGKKFVAYAVDPGGDTIP